MQVSFTVYGCAQPQGSTRGFIPKGSVRPIITSDNAKLKPWRQDISSNAVLAMAKTNQHLSTDPVEVQACFYFAKPKSAPKRVTHKITKPDIDKIARSLLDGLTGIVFKDDAQVVSLSCHKRFGLPERVDVQVLSITETAAERRSA